MKLSSQLKSKGGRSLSPISPRFKYHRSRNFLSGGGHSLSIAVYVQYIKAAGSRPCSKLYPLSSASFPFRAYYLLSQIFLVLTQLLHFVLRL